MIKKICAAILLFSLLFSGAFLLDTTDKQKVAKLERMVSLNQIEMVEQQPFKPREYIRVK